MNRLRDECNRKTGPSSSIEEGARSLSGSRKAQASWAPSPRRSSSKPFEHIAGRLNTDDLQNSRRSDDPAVAADPYCKACPTADRTQKRKKKRPRALVLKKKFSHLSVASNNYIHPSTHPAPHPSSHAHPSSFPTQPKRKNAHELLRSRTIPILPSPSRQWSTALGWTVYTSVHPRIQRVENAQAASSSVSQTP